MIKMIKKTKEFLEKECLFKIAGYFLLFFAFSYILDYLNK